MLYPMSYGRVRVYKLLTAFGLFILTSLGTTREPLADDVNSDVFRTYFPRIFRSEGVFIRFKYPRSVRSASQASIIDRTPATSAFR